MIEQLRHALLIVLSGPSGTGKTTLCDRLVADFASVTYSVSCTTRPARPDEVDGRHYHFLDENTFRAREESGAFLETAVVHGRRYGTLSQSVREALAVGRDVLMDIDVQGAARIRAAAAAAPSGDPLCDSLVDVFIAPPSLTALGQRLRDRGQDRQDIIQRRLSHAGAEMARCAEYRYLVVNDDLDDSYGVLRSVVVAEHHRVRKGRTLSHAG